MRPQNHRPLTSTFAQPNKDVIGKQGQLNFPPPIAPLVDRIVQRKEDPDVLFFEFGSDLLFVPRLGVYGKPFPRTSCERRLKRSYVLLKMVVQGSAYLDYKPVPLLSGAKSSAMCE